MAELPLTRQACPDPGCPGLEREGDRMSGCGHALRDRGCPFLPGGGFGGGLGLLCGWVTRFDLARDQSLREAVARVLHTYDERPVMVVEVDPTAVCWPCHDDASPRPDEMIPFWVTMHTDQCAVYLARLEHAIAGPEVACTCDGEAEPHLMRGASFTLGGRRP